MPIHHDIFTSLYGGDAVQRKAYPLVDADAQIEDCERHDNRNLGDELGGIGRRGYRTIDFH